MARRTWLRVWVSINGNPWPNRPITSSSAYLCLPNPLSKCTTFFNEINALLKLERVRYYRILVFCQKTVLIFWIIWLSNRAKLLTVMQYGNFNVSFD